MDDVEGYRGMCGLKTHKTCDYEPIVHSDLKLCQLGIYHRKKLGIDGLKSVSEIFLNSAEDLWCCVPQVTQNLWWASGLGDTCLMRWKPRIPKSRGCGCTE